MKKYNQKKLQKKLDKLWAKSEELGILHNAACYTSGINRYASALQREASDANNDAWTAYHTLKQSIHTEYDNSNRKKTK